MSERLVRIGELAARAGVSTRTVDYYTHLGLISPAERTASNYRLYDPADVDRIATIRQLETHGVSLDEIASALHGQKTADFTTILNRLDDDLQALHTAATTAGPHMHGLLSAIAARAHGLITTALDLTTHLPPP